MLNLIKSNKKSVHFTENDDNNTNLDTKSNKTIIKQYRKYYIML